MSTRNQNGNYQIVLSTKLNLDTLNNQIKEINKNPPEIKIKFSIDSKSLEKIKELNELLNKTEALNNYTNGLKNIQSTMQSYEKVAEKVVTATNNLANSAQVAGKASDTAGKQVKSFGEKAMDAFQKFSLWSVVSGMFYKIVRAAEGLIDTAIELDTAFTELSKVTDLTRDDFDRLTQQAYELGSEVAKTTTEVVNAMTEFARAGFSVEESSGILAKNALMWTNIADGTVDASESANMIISVMKAFNVEAENTTHIIDALNEVSNNYAVSSGELSNSLTKSSAVLANANVTFEEQLGLITAGTEILRNANIVSTGLRTISLRLQGMEEDGEKVDGLTAKLEGDFNQLGLTLYDTNGSIKDTYQILKELSEVYPSLNAEQKAYYTELIAGKTRAQVAAAILNNFSTAINATETAYNSAGSAAEENAKVLESLNGHIQAFKAEWESLINSKATQDTLKFLIDIGTNIVKLIKDLGGLKTIIIGIGVAIAALKWKTWMASLTSIVNGLKLYIATSGQATGALITQAQATDLLAAKNLLLKASMAAIVLAIAAVVVAINKIKQKIEEWKQAEKEKNEQIVASAKEAYKSAKELSDLYQSYKELADLTSRTTEQENEYTTAIKNVAEALGYKTSALDDATIKQQEYLDKINETYEAEMKQSRAQIASSLNVQKKQLDEKVSYENDDYKYLRKSGSIFPSGLDEYLANLKEVNEAKEEFDRLTDQEQMTIQDATKKVYDHNWAYEQASGAVKELEEDSKGLINSYVQLGILDRQLSGQMPKTEEEQKAFAQEIVDTIPHLDEYSNVLYNIVYNLLPKLKVDVQPQADGWNIDKYITNMKNLESACNSLNSAFEEFKTNGSLSAETIATLTSTMVTLSDGTQTALINFVSFTENGIKVNTQALQDNIEKIKEDAIENVKDSTAKQILALATEDLSKKTETLKTDVNNATTEISGSISTDEAKIKSNIGLATSYDMLRDAMNGTGSDTSNWVDENSAKITQKLVEAKNIIDALNNMSYTPKKTSTTTGKTTKSTTDEWKTAFTKAYNDLKNRRDRDLIDTETYYKELKELNDKYFKDREQYVEEYAKYELELYKGIKEVFKEQIDDMQHAITMLENQGADKEVIIAKYKELQDKLHEQAEYYRSLNLEGNQDEIDSLSEQWWQYQKTIEKLQKEITDDLKEQLDKQVDELTKRFEALRDVALDTIEKQIDEKEAWLEEQNNLLDEQIDKYNEQKDTLEDEKEIQEKLLKIEEARKKLAEAKNKRVRVYREGQGFVYETDFDAVASAQNELDELLEDWQLFQEKARIQDIVAQLEAEKQANKDRVNKEIEDLNRLKDAWDKSLDLAQDVENYKGWLTKIENSEDASFDNRLNLVKEFVKSYNAEMAQLKASYPTVSGTTTTSQPSVNAVSNNMKTYNGVRYNPNTDYQQLINEAKASGAPEDHLVGLEKQRNAKIAGEGITDYAPTYNYTSPSSSSSKSSSSSSKSSSSSSSSSNSSSSSSSSGTLLSKVASAVSTVIKAVTGYASGTEDADGMMHFVGENGPELYVPPEGAGIIPSKLTGNLMAWGTINPMQLVKSFNNGDGTVIQIDNVELPNVKDGESFVNELKNFKSFAIQRDSNRK